MSKKKLYISCPRTGLSEEYITKMREKMHKLAEVIFEQELDVIELAPDKFDNRDKDPIYNIGENITRMANADYFIGTYGYMDNFPESGAENNIARSYGLETCCIDLEYINNVVYEMNRMNGRVGRVNRG